MPLMYFIWLGHYKSVVQMLHVVLTEKSVISMYCTVQCVFVTRPFQSLFTYYLVNIHFVYTYCTSSSLPLSLYPPPVRCLSTMSQVLLRRFFLFRSALYGKYHEITSAMIWRYINKSELNCHHAFSRQLSAIAYFFTMQI